MEKIKGENEIVSKGFFLNMQEVTQFHIKFLKFSSLVNMGEVSREAKVKL